MCFVAMASDAVDNRILWWCVILDRFGDSNVVCVAVGITDWHANANIQRYWLGDGLEVGFAIGHGYCLKYDCI